MEVGRHYARLGIPFVFVTGNLKRIPPDFAGAIGAIEKPYSQNGLQNALSYIERLLAQAAEAASGAEQPPPSLVLPGLRLNA